MNEPNDHPHRIAPRTSALSTLKAVAGEFKPGLIFMSILLAICLGIAAVRMYLRGEQIHLSYVIELKAASPDGSIPPTLEVMVFHSLGQPVNGTYTIRAYGPDLAGHGGEDSPGAKNFWAISVTNASPGESSGAKAVLTLREEHPGKPLPPIAEAMEHVRVVFFIHFEGRSADGTKRSVYWLAATKGFPPDSSLRKVLAGDEERLNRGDLDPEDTHRSLSKLFTPR